jgi:hypothetical protein
MRIKNLFQNWRRPARSWAYKGVRVVLAMSNIPAGDLRKEIYLVGKEGDNHWVVFDCPKGHGRRIEVNLMRSIKPFWDIDFRDGTVSLYPSVSVSDKGCDCHFWLKRNKAHEAFWR